MGSDEKLDLILSKVSKIQTDVAVGHERIFNLQKKVEVHETKIEIHEKNQNKFFGGISILGLLATAFFSWLFKSIN